jgi:hypothetical protein
MLGWPRLQHIPVNTQHASKSHRSVAPIKLVSILIYFRVSSDYFSDLIDPHENPSSDPGTAAPTFDMAVPLIIDPSSNLIFEPGTVILDASWLYEPDPPTRNAFEEFTAGPRFPGARFWSLDDVSEPHPDGYILMLPSPERFAAFAGKHGVSKDSHVIVYDNNGVFASPRTAWTFKVTSSNQQVC